MELLHERQGRRVYGNVLYIDNVQSIYVRAKATKN